MATYLIYSLILHDALPIFQNNNEIEIARDDVRFAETQLRGLYGVYDPLFSITPQIIHNITPQQSSLGDRKSTRLNSSHLVISYAVFCLKEKNPDHRPTAQT